MKKQTLILLVFTTILVSCWQTTTKDNSKKQTFTLKKLTALDFSFFAPANYEILYPDTANRPYEGYLLSKCAKMYFNNGGLGSGEILDRNRYKGYTVLQDTSGGYLKMVVYKFDSIAHLEVHVAKLNKVDVSLIFGKGNLLSNHNYVYVFNGMTDMGYGQPTCMTKDEMESLAKEFIKGTIK